MEPFGAVRREVGRYFAAQQFLTRLPCPAWTPYTPTDLAASAGWFSCVGLLVGGVVGAIVVALRDVVTPTFAAIVAIAAGAAVTGAFHEDGFADTCDAFGGYTVERRREIMRDSRVGTFGALGLFSIVLAKISVLGSLASELSSWMLFLVCICAHTVSRAATVLAIRLVPAVNDPTSKTQNYRVSWGRVAFAMIVPAVPLAVATFRWDAAVLGGCIVVLVEFARPFFQRFSSGVSGDGLGAINQVAEVLVWATAAATLLAH